MRLLTIRCVLNRMLQETRLKDFRLGESLFGNLNCGLGSRVDRSSFVVLWIYKYGIAGWLTGYCRSTRFFVCGSGFSCFSCEVLPAVYGLDAK